MRERKRERERERERERKDGFVTTDYVEIAFPPR